MINYSSPEEKPLGPTPADVPLDSLPTVELTDTQFARAQEIARSRSRSYETIDGGRICGNQTSTAAHLTGVIGELAYAIKYNESIDNSIYDYGDNGYDFDVDPLTIDTKATSTHLTRPDLIVPVEPEPTADLYFLLHRIEEKTVRIIGFATRVTVTDRDPVREPGDSLNYVLQQNELWLPPSITTDSPENLHKQKYIDDT